MTNIREVDARDYAVIDAGIRARVWERSNKEWTKLIDPYMVRQVLINKHPDIHSIIVEETYLVSFALAKLWFTEEYFIEEKLVIRAYKDGKADFNSVIDALEHTARMTGAKGIITGTLMAPNNRAMSRLYQKRGFKIVQLGMLKTMG